MEREKKYKKIITMLLILLCISLVALTGTEIYKHFAPKESTSVSVPENYIIPEEGGNTDNQIENTENNTGTNNSNSSNEDNATTEGSNDGSSGGSNDGSSGGSNDGSSGGSNDGSSGGSNDGSSGGSSGGSSDGSSDGSNDGSSGGSNDGSSDGSNGGSNDGSNDSDSSKPTSTVISLHKGQFTDNEPFKVINMLPGDSEVKNFCLKVSYKNSGRIHFLVDIHNKPEKLLEVLKLKVVLLNSGDVLYDGLMRDMGELDTYTLKKSDVAKTEELYYEISTYLDASVGNEYMDSTELKADFKWWVDEKANLVRAPGKLDYSNVALSLGLITGSLLILKLSFRKNKKIGGEPDAK
ncbi:hypothetical protein [Bacillus sp. FJAT-27986]|uniref:hypothetical protein n=1 Tax=Bacillus sp. FJAT-27986 TaxID=1743146 RepID=UPI00080AE127|nr:hypothetical protein [Bacillus sp. FJAT-27986]OCA80768.1 hypothetical protein A8L44_16525 [Bacillus sp. FJAT-27986]